MDAYQAYLANQRAAALNELLPSTARLDKDGFNLSLSPEYSPTASTENFQLAEPFSTQQPAAYTGSTAGAPMDVGTATMVGGGLMAAGQAAGTLAQLTGWKAAQGTTQQQNLLNRDMTERMARAALMQSSEQFNASNKMNAYQQLVNAFNQATANAMQQRSLNRSNHQSQGAGLTTAYLH